MGSIQFLNFARQASDPMAKRISDELSTFQNNIEHKYLFYVPLDPLGEHMSLHQFLLRERENFEHTGTCLFTSSVVGIVVTSPTPFYTKTFLKKFLFMVNEMGAEIMGHPAVEVLPFYENFKTRSEVEGVSREEACYSQIMGLIKRLLAYTDLKKDHFNILALHAGHEEMSTTLHLWHLIKTEIAKKLPDQMVSLEEIHVEEGKITDCYGCPFETCLYYGVDKRCFYGGIVVEALFPALERADLVVWVCPNYNDAISAKLMAVINRMTALYRQMSFHDKYIGAVIVSANSGMDTVAGQLIGALCVNKGFRIGPNFSVGALANHPSALQKIDSLASNVSSYVDALYANVNKNIN